MRKKAWQPMPSREEGLLSPSIAWSKRPIGTEMTKTLRTVVQETRTIHDPRLAQPSTSG